WYGGMLNRPWGVARDGSAAALANTPPSTGTIPKNGAGTAARLATLANLFASSASAICRHRSSRRTTPGWLRFQARSTQASAVETSQVQAPAATASAGADINR